MTAFKKRSVVGYFMRQSSWAYALLVAAGFGLAGYQLANYQAASRFVAEGLESVGQVTHKSGYNSGAGSSSKSTYRVSYDFPTAADPYTHGKQSVSKEFYDAQAEGAAIVVHYLPADPSVSVVELAKLTRAFGWGMLVSAGLIVGGVVGSVVAMSRARACVTLRETGELQTATVLSHSLEGKKKDKGYMVWRDAAGTEGRTLTAPLAQLMPVGSSITLFVDPENRSKAVWEGDIGSR